MSRGWIAYGASPRATLGIIAASRALALVRGRDYVVPQDVIEVIPDVLRHRLVLSYDALADEVTPDDRHRPGAADRRTAAGRRAAGSHRSRSASAGRTAGTAVQRTGQRESTGHSQSTGKRRADRDR